MIPKGKLLLIGGHEEKGEPNGENLDVHKKVVSLSHFEILGTLISTIPRRHHIIEIIAAASAIPQEMEQLYVDSFRAEGFTKVGIICIASKAEAQNPLLRKRIQGAHAVFFTGGDQEKLISLVAGTSLLEAIRKKYYGHPQFIVGGTSAGAMVMPRKIIAGGLIHEALYRGDLVMTEGLGLLQEVIIDTHFVKRGRFARLAHAVALHPSCLGIGLGEDTAILVSEGKNLQVIGSGMVIMIDGRKMGATNVTSVSDDRTPIVMENLIVSILAEGSCYTLDQEAS